jgi:hypothetical protein
MVQVSAEVASNDVHELLVRVHMLCLVCCRSAVQATCSVCAYCAFSHTASTAPCILSMAQLSAICTLLVDTSLTTVCCAVLLCSCDHQVTLISVASGSCTKPPTDKKLPAGLAVGKLKQLCKRLFGLDTDLQVCYNLNYRIHVVDCNAVYRAQLEGLHLSLCAAVLCCSKCCGPSDGQECIRWSHLYDVCTTADEQNKTHSNTVCYCCKMSTGAVLQR